LEIDVVRGYSVVTPTQPAKGNKMNIAKHMEAIFVATVTLACAVSYTMSPATPPQSSQSVVLSDATVRTVTITAKRLTPAQKAKFQSEDSKRTVAAA